MLEKSGDRYARADSNVPRHDVQGASANAALKRHLLIVSTGTRLWPAQLRRTSLILVAVLAMLAAGCGKGSQSAEPTTQTSAQPTTTQPSTRTTVQATPACPAEVRAYVTALQGLFIRVKVGATYSSYTDKLGDIAVSQGSIGRAGLSPACLRVLDAADTALRYYKRAATVWGRCLQSLSCSQGVPVAAKYVRKAETRIALAKQRLAALH